MQPDHGQSAFCWIRDLVPRQVTPGPERARRRACRNVFDTLMIWLSAVPKVAHLGNFSPGHERRFGMQIDDELADLWWKGIGSFSLPALLSRREEALHPRAFKFVGFAGQR